MTPREEKRLKYSFRLNGRITEEEIFESREKILKALVQSLNQYLPKSYSIVEIDGRIFVSIEDNPKRLFNKIARNRENDVLIDEPKTVQELINEAQIVIPPFETGKEIESSVSVKYSGIVYALLLAAKNDFGDRMELKMEMAPETVFGTENSPGILDVIKLAKDDATAMTIGVECAKYLANALQQEIETAVAAFRGLPKQQREMGLKKVFVNIAKRYGVEAFITEKQEGNFFKKKQYITLEDERGREILSLCMNDCSYTYNFLLAEKMFEREARDFIRHFSDISSILLYLKGRAERGAPYPIPATDNDTLRESVEVLFKNKVKTKVIDVDQNTKLVRIPFGSMKVEIDNLGTGRIVEVEKPKFVDVLKVISTINAYRAGKTTEISREEERGRNRNDLDL